TSVVLLAQPSQLGMLAVPLARALSRSSDFESKHQGQGPHNPRTCVSMSHDAVFHGPDERSSGWDQPARPEGWDGKANITNLRILSRSLSVSDAYLRTIESSISIVLVSLPIWKSRLQVATSIAER